MREIMGPGSVVFTWSEVDCGGKENGDGEGEGGGLGDDEAEEMVSHPELVVYPYMEPHHPSPSQSSPFSSEKHKPQTKPKRYETRTAVIIGAVIVLGVSIGVAAVYGARGSRGGGGWSWRKVGGKLIGAGESLRVVDGLGFW
jgi:TBC1 domain family member 20